MPPASITRSHLWVSVLGKLDLNQLGPEQSGPGQLGPKAQWSRAQVPAPKNCPGPNCEEPIYEPLGNVDGVVLQENFPYGQAAQLATLLWRMVTNQEVKVRTLFNRENLWPFFCSFDPGPGHPGVATWCLKVVQATKNSPTVESGFFGRY